MPRSKKQTKEIRFLMEKTINVFFLMFACAGASAMTVDGVLDEEIWSDAKVIKKFVTVSPLSLDHPKYETEVKLLSAEEGIYVGITNYQPQSGQQSGRSVRDLEITTADNNTVIIDFDGKGLTAYSFQIGSGGSKRDGIWRNESDFSDDWDGSWQAITQTAEDKWTSEILIPWEVASMKKVREGERSIGFYVRREVRDDREIYASSPIDTTQMRFLSNIETTNIEDFSGSSLQVFGTTTGRRNLVADENFFDAGIDVFWKPDSSKQLSMTVNPDFGDVEVDELVVNFSPIENFFSENRAFFTENQAMFELNGAKGLRLVHTRRIGASPDTGDKLESDIDLALKYTSIGDKLNYGVFTSFEDDDGDVEGRSFYVARGQLKNESNRFGGLITRVDRPELDRTATVLMTDYRQSFGEKWETNLQLIHSDIEEADVETTELGGWVIVQYQSTPTWKHALEITEYGEEFEVNDLGFLPRNNIRSLRYENSWENNRYSEKNPVNEVLRSIQVNHEENLQGDHLRTHVTWLNDYFFKNTSNLEVRLRLGTEGTDDLIARGNGNLNTKENYEFEMFYENRNKGKLRNHSFIFFYDETVLGKGVSAHVHPSYYFTDNHWVSLGATYTVTEESLIWQNDRAINSYDQDYLNITFDINSTFQQKHEVTFRVEWLGLNAKGNKAYLVDAEGNLRNQNLDVNEFSISDLAAQLRYNYEITPLSNLTVVYTRGGSIGDDARASYSNLFSDSWSQRSAENFLIKLRYQFY